MKNFFERLFTWITQIGVFFEFLYKFITGGVSFLWNACGWAFSVVELLPSWVTGTVVLGISVCIVLLILGR